MISARNMSVFAVPNVRVSVSNDTVESNLMKIWAFQLQHLLDAVLLDLVSRLADLNRSTIPTTKGCADQLLAILVEQIEGAKICTRGDLDQLCETVPDLSLRQSTQEGKIQECLHWGVVSTQTVLVIAIVDGNFDRHGSIDQSNHRSWDPNVVGIAAVGSTCKSVDGLV